MKELADRGSISDGTRSVLDYFGLFRHPLRPEEIHRFHPVKCAQTDVDESLITLVSAGFVNRFPGDLYACGGDSRWAEQRETGRRKALALLSSSPRYVKIIRAFPYVRAVAISGSLSKYAAGKEADIDYFIITAPGRLWIARTLLHLFKKLTFAAGLQHRFCMNYFIDETALEITDRNLYTAIELVTLIPAYNAALLDRLQKANAWTAEFLPNAGSSHDLSYLTTSGREPLKRALESFLELLRPDTLNRKLMSLTDRKWRKKWKRKGFPMEQYDEAFFTSLNVSKNHPANFRRQILEALAAKARGEVRKK